MRLIKARVQNYRSVRDTGEFEIEPGKTIMVGPNEAGKTAVLQAIQQLNRPDDIEPFDALRDYPRADYIDIVKGKTKESEVEVVMGLFELNDDELALIPEPIRSQNVQYQVRRYLDDKFTNCLVGAVEAINYKDIKMALTKLSKHLDNRASVEEGDQSPSAELAELTKGWHDYSQIEGTKGKALVTWLEATGYEHVDDSAAEHIDRLNDLIAKASIQIHRNTAVSALKDELPTFVLFSDYFRVRPNIHLGKLATRIANNTLDDDAYDYGNQCLLKLLGLDVEELASVADGTSNRNSDLDSIRDALDSRQYQLNSASVQLTKSISKAWNPNEVTGEASKLNIRADGQYLKVVVEDDIGVEVELDQRSQGFQWLVSFFVVFFAEAEGDHSNAILLLDEPGLHLHGLKQREFRKTLSQLAEDNQTIFTTHSPFLVGPEELDLVRVVDMENRKTGTKVHTNITSSDPAALLPLQQALGYDLAQSLFAQQKNLVVEGLTDYWYITAIAEMFRADELVTLDEKIAINPAGSASKVVYYSTILHSQSLKIAALLDSDMAGDTAASDETLSHILAKGGILRVGDFSFGEVKNPEIEDLLRDTLPAVIKAEFDIEVGEFATQPKRSAVAIMESQKPKVTKYRLAKGFLRWCRTHSSEDLSETERATWQAVFKAANKALK